MASSQSHFNILFILFGIRGINFRILRLDELIEIVSRGWLRISEGHSHVMVELFGKGIAIIDSKNAFEEADVHGKIEVLPCVMVCQLSDDLGHLLPLQEHSLRDSTVFDFGFRDEDGLVRQVIIDLDLADSIIFKPAFHDVLLEVGIEPQHFAVILDPGRLHPRDGLVLRLLPFLLKAQIGDAFGQLVNEIHIDFLAHILPLLLLAIIGVHELLSLVEVLLVRVVENVAWQEGHLLRQIRLHLVSCIYLLYLSL